ncbi:MAG: hypothetical protein FJ125_10655, partial [Deltaproteobacteria bacterium]|nr:hypothetical protein [Deltaproteobacteria bacterium]
GVGVKNGINWNGRKNFLGCFAPPAAVVNDIDLLRTLPPRERRAGLAEAVKVALIHDAAFFVELERDRAELALGTEDATERAIRRCAALHLNHIATGGDPFELGSARPLDFGHWSAHRLEEMTAGGLRHGEAVAIGMALDAGYACRAGLLSQDEHGRILTLIAGLGLPLCHPELLRLDVPAALASFREHLGGELTITLPRGIGRGIEVHDIDTDAVRACIADLASIPGAGGAAGARSLARGGSHVADPLPTVRRGGSPGVLPREPLACARAGSLLGPAGPEP